MAISLKYPDASYKKTHSHTGVIRDFIKIKKTWCQNKACTQYIDTPNTVIQKMGFISKPIAPARAHMTHIHKLNGLSVWIPPSLTYAQACRPITQRIKFRKQILTTPIVKSPASTAIAPFSDKLCSIPKPPLPTKDMDLMLRIKQLIQNFSNIQSSISELASKAQLLALNCPSKKSICELVTFKLQNLIPSLLQDIPAQTLPIKMLNPLSIMVWNTNEKWLKP
jgi:hypothetical protein